jgi:hypothetical protein
MRLLGAGRTDGRTERQTDKKTDRQRDRQTETDRQTDMTNLRVAYTILQRRLKFQIRTEIISRSCYSASRSFDAEKTSNTLISKCFLDLYITCSSDKPHAEAALTSNMYFRATHAVLFFRYTFLSRKHAFFSGISKYPKSYLVLDCV